MQGLKTWYFIRTYFYALLCDNNQMWKPRDWAANSLISRGEAFFEWLKGSALCLTCSFAVSLHQMQSQLSWIHRFLCSLKIGEGWENYLMLPLPCTDDILGLSYSVPWLQEAIVSTYISEIAEFQSKIHFDLTRSYQGTGLKNIHHELPVSTLWKLQMKHQSIHLLNYLVAS